MASLESIATRLVQASLSFKSTQSYNVNLAQFQKFVESLPAYYHVGPPNPGHIALFVAHLYDSGLTASTITTKLSSLSFYFKLIGVEDVIQSFIVQKALNGVRKLSPSGDLRLPVTIPILETLIANTGHVTSNYDESLLLKAMLTLSFYCFLRPGEVTDSENNLPFSSLKLFADHLEVTFFKYKHMSGPPTTIHVAKQPNVTCPVMAVKAYVARRGRADGPLFCFNTMVPVSYKIYNTCFSRLTSLCNINGKLGLHSMRIGAASLAASRGLSPILIQQMGRWKSSAYSRYIRIPHITL